MGGRSLRLTVQAGPSAGASFELPADGTITVGSDPSCGIVLELPGVIAHHCILRCAAGRVLLLAEGAEAQVLVNNEAVRKRFLEPGDRIEVGGAVMALEVLRDDPLVGSVVGGYKIQRLVGQGAMGSVYEATQISLDRTVALKILSPKLTEDKNFVAQFLKEARSAAKLNHPNVVQVYDAGQEGDLFFFSMEYLSGGSLAKILEEKGSLPVETALLVARDTARALEWAQEHGIVHRDIKPDNLLFATDGSVKVADLGIAADLRAPRSSGKQGSAGSPRYMAPEQALGQPVDHRADIYALGGTLYRMIAGSPPFPQKTPAEVIKAKTTSDPVPLSRVVQGLPGAVSRAVQKMLARDPAQRPQTCGDALATLEHCLDVVQGRKTEEHAVAAAPRRRQEPLAELLRSPGTKFALGLAALCFFIVLIVVVGRLSGPPPAQQQEPPTVAAGPTVPEQEPGGAEQAPPSSPGRTSETRDTVERANAKGAPGAEEGLDPAEVEILRELGRIYKDWQASLLDGRRALAALEDFKRKHPQASYVERADQFIERIRGSVVEAGKAALGKLQGKVSDLVAASEFRQAAKLLFEIADQYPEIRAEVNEEARKVGEAAEAAWKKASEEADLAAKEGQFGKAAGLIRDLETKLPATFQERIAAKLAAFDTEAKDHASASELIVAASEKMRAALASLDFEGVSSAISSLPEARGPVALKKAALAAEARMARDAWEALSRGVQSSVEGGKSLQIAFDSDPARSAAAYRLRGLESSLLVIQKEGASKTDKVPLLSLATKSLVELMAKGDKAKNGSGGGGGGTAAGDLAADALEGLGLLLLHTQGPERARELLTDARLGSEKAETYATRLEGEAPSYLSQFTSGAVARLEAVRGGQDAKAGRPTAETISQAEGLASEVLRCLAQYRGKAGYKSARGKLCETFLAARSVALRPAVPRNLFHGRVKSYKSDGTISLLYEFDSDEEVMDFLPVKGPGGRMEREGKMARVKGEVRLGQGDVFRNKLSVATKVPGGGYSLQSPNINLALWTRDDDAVSAALGVTSTIVESSGTTGAQPRYADPPDDYFVFGIGYKVRFYNRRVYEYDYLSLRGQNQVVPMPANVLLGGVRGKPLHSTPDDDCVWGEGAVSKTKGMQVCKVSMSKESLSWKINERTVPLGSAKGLDLLQRSDPFLGSLTVLTNGEIVYYDAISVEGELNPEWIEQALQRLAVDELRRVEPDYPFVKAAPKKSTDEGSIKAESSSSR